MVAVVGCPVQVEGWVNQLKDEVGNSEAGKDARGLGEKGGGGGACLRDAGVKTAVCMQR